MQKVFKILMIFVIFRVYLKGIENFVKSMAILEYLIPHHRYDLISKLRNQGSICTEEIIDFGVKITASPRGGLEELLSEFKVF